MFQSKLQVSSALESPQKHRAEGPLTDLRDHIELLLHSRYVIQQVSDSICGVSVIAPTKHPSTVVVSLLLRVHIVCVNA